jgi:methylated-DNA-[protein]-cysteine S-methyltransferase
MHNFQLSKSRSIAIRHTLDMDSILQASVSFNSPLGRLRFGATTKGLSAVDFVSKKGGPLDFSDYPTAQEHCLAARDWLERYFEGERTPYGGALDLQGTVFQQEVWAQISRASFGETLTYGQIASSIMRPMASRAVGAAVGANPVPLVIPCHRVLGSGGKITGYSGGEGIPTKQKLLKLEGIEYLA